MARRRSALGLPPHVDRFWSKKAKKYYYAVRIGHGPRVALKSLPGTEAFTAERAEALAQLTGSIGASLAAPGSVRSIVTSYLNSDHFAATFKPSVRAKHKRTLERFAGKNGGKTFAALTGENVAAMLGKIGTPHMQKLWRQAMVGLCKWAVGEKLIARSPMRDLDPIKMPKAVSHRRWMPEHVKTFRGRHKSGSIERLALELLLNSAARGRSDVRRMGRANVRNGNLIFTARKNGATMVVPVLPGLAAELAARDPDDLVFFRGKTGAPMAEGTWGRMFRKAVTAAGLDADLTPHGIRHAAACEAAEHGASEATIMAILGDTDPRAAAVYVRQARKAMLIANHYAARAAAGTNQVPVTGSGSQTVSQTEG
jgi:integrase